MSKATVNIVKISFFLTLLNILGKGLGFLREMVLAYFYGLNWEYDIFLVSTTLLVIINSTVYYLSQNYFIPFYNKFLEDKNNSNAGKYFLSYSLLMFVLGGLLVLLFLFAFRDVILQIFISSNNYNKFILAEKIYSIYLFIIPFNAGFSILAAYYQAEFKFIKIVLSQIFVNVVVVLGIILFAKTYGILVIAYSTLIATFLQFLFVLLPVKKDIIINRNILKIFNEKSNVLTNALIITLLIELVSLSYSFIDRFFYSQLTSGSISALNYAFNLVSLPLNIFSFAVLSVMFSKFSYNMGQNLLKENEYYFYKNLKYIFLTTIPIAILFYMHGSIAIRFLFERGNFSSDNTYLTANILKYFAIGFPFITAFSVINKLMYSYKLIGILLGITIIAAVVKLFTSFLFISNLLVNALALSTSVSFLIIFILGYIYITKKLNFKNYIYVFKYFIIYLIFSLINITICSSLAYYFFPTNQLMYHLVSSVLFIVLFSTVTIYSDSEIKNYVLRFLNKFNK